MTLFTANYVKCDCCTTKREYKALLLPRGWSSASSVYGEMYHACPLCRAWIESKAKDEGLRMFPEKVIVVREAKH